MARNKNTDIDSGYVELDLPEDETTIDPEATAEPQQPIRLRKRNETPKKQRKVEMPADDDEDDEDDEFEQISFRNIIGGDILQSKFFLSKVMFIIFCVVLMLIYTGNRYGSLQDIITIDSLKQELRDVHYEVLTQSSDLINLSRQSNIETKLAEQGDSAMLNNNTPPFALPEEE